MASVHPIVAATAPESHAGQVLPLSYEQEAMWFMQQLDPEATAYHVSGALRFRGEVDVAALEWAVGRIAERHHVLRTRFVERNGSPVQVVDVPHAIPIPCDDLSALSNDEQCERISATVQRERRAPFDLAAGPTWRLRLLRLGTADYLLVRTTHHIVWDDWSQEIFERELAELYVAYVARRPDPLPALSLQYADFSVWQRAPCHEAAIDGGLRYWTETLAGAPADLRLPSKAVPIRQRLTAGTHRIVLPSATLAALRDLARAYRATLYVTLLAGFGALLAAHSGQDDVVIGSPVNNRMDALLANLIGLFVNQVGMRLRIPADATFAGLLPQVRRTVLDGYRHRDVPFQRVVRKLVRTRVSNVAPLCQAIFASHKVLPRSFRFGDVHAERVDVVVEGSEVADDLVLHSMEYTDALRMTWYYKRDLFDQDYIAELADGYHAMLRQVTVDPHRPVRHLVSSLRGTRE